MYERKKSLAEDVESLKADMRRLMQRNSDNMDDKESSGVYAELDERSKMVVEYIRGNPNCTKQSVVEGLEGKIARFTVFKIIEELVLLGIVNDTPDAKNRHTRSLVINSNSDFLIVLNELDQFKRDFKRLLSKTWEKAEREYAPVGPTDRPKDEYFQLVSVPYHIVDSILQSYLIRALFIWPLKYQDRKNVLRRLTILIFSRIINLLLYEIPKVVVEGTDIAIDQYMLFKLLGTVHLKKFSEFSRKFELDKEMNPILDDLWSINKEVQEYAYPEPRIFPSNEFEYGKDDWRKLLEIINRHGGRTIADLKKMPIDGLLNINKDEKS